MKLAEIDQVLAEDLGQTVNEGPFDWMLRSSRIGQWLASREGKKAQQEIAIMYIKALSAWRGFNGVKQVTPNALVTWLRSDQKNYGLGLPQSEVTEIMADPGIQKALMTRGPLKTLDNSKIKEFIIALSRVNFDDIANAAKAQANKPAEPKAEPAADDGRIEPTLDVVPGGKASAGGASAAG